jgi:hypothetical protein
VLDGAGADLRRLVRLLGLAGELTEAGRVGGTGQHPAVRHRTHSDLLGSRLARVGGAPGPGGAEIHRADPQLKT